MAEHNLLGKKGEEIAADFLKSIGHIIIARNWRFGKNEIDIISKNNNTLVITEVKTRTSSFVEDPLLSVDKKKQKFLIKAADAFIINNNIDLEARFDIVTVVIENNNNIINHIEDAFYPLLK